MRTMATGLSTLFTAALELVRLRFRLPHEQAGNYDPEDVDELLSILPILQRDTPQWTAFAALIPRSQLPILFPALLRTEDPEYLAKMTALLVERVTPSLHSVGWAYLQFHYDDARMGAAFAEFHQALVEKYPDRAPEMPLEGLLQFDDTLPEQVYGRIHESKVLEVAPFFARYGILEETPFARAVLALFFAACKDEAYLRNAEFFLRLLPHLSGEDGGRVLRHYLREYRLENQYHLLNDGIQESLGSPDSGHPAWSKVPEAARAKFWKWRIARGIEIHLAESPRKYAFLLQYIAYMDSVHGLMDGVLAMKFDSFYLVDDRRFPDLGYYYDKAAFDLWYEAWTNLGSEPEAPASGAAVEEAPLPDLAELMAVRPPLAVVAEAMPPGLSHVDILLAEIEAERKAQAREAAIAAGLEVEPEPAGVEPTAMEPTAELVPDSVVGSATVPDPEPEPVPEPEEDDSGLYGVTAGRIEPVGPSLPMQPAKLLVMEQFKASAVLLNFEGVGMLFARDFLDSALGIKKRVKGQDGAAARLF